jgi:hypothetical protein
MKTFGSSVFLAAFLFFFSSVHAQDMRTPIRPVVKHSVFTQGWVNLGFYPYTEGGQYSALFWPVQTQVGYAYQYGDVRFTANVGGANTIYVDGPAQRDFTMRRFGLTGQRIITIYRSWSYVATLGFSLERLRGELDANIGPPPSAENVTRNYLGSQVFAGFRYDNIGTGFDFECHPLGASVIEDGTVQLLVGYLVFEYDF